MFPHLGWLQEECSEKCSPLSNSSVCLSLFSWCGTAVHLCTCSDTSTASWSSLEIWTAPESQIRTPAHSQSKSHLEQLRPVWNVEMFDALVRSGLSFVTRSASLLPTFLSQLFSADQTEPMQQDCSPPCKAMQPLMCIPFFQGMWELTPKGFGGGSASSSSRFSYTWFLGIFWTQQVEHSHLHFGSGGSIVVAAG